VDGETIDENLVIEHAQSVGLEPIEDDRSSLAKDLKPEPLTV
jgi:hypothetical protein